MKPIPLIASWSSWPAPAQRFYLGMIQSEQVNGLVLVPPSQQAAAAELIAAANEDRVPAVWAASRDKIGL